MFLNIWESIRNFFSNFFSNIPWSNIFILLTGVVIGFIICGILYLIILVRSIKKADRINKEQYNTNDVEKLNEVNNIIRGAKDQYKEECNDYTIAQKMELVKDISWILVNDIAKTYYPDSKYPVYELTVGELIKLCYYITQRIDVVFQGKLLRYARNFKVSQIMAVIDAKKKIDDNKIVKASKKLHVKGIYKASSTVVNIINPVYWVKKIMISSSLNKGLNVVATTIIDIVGEETAKVYSKHLFTLDNEIDINETLENLEKEINEE